MDRWLKERKNSSKEMDVFTDGLSNEARDGKKGTLYHNKYLPAITLEWNWCLAEDCRISVEIDVPAKTREVIEIG
jgi:hypothetical protein